jgi:aminodeoxychorismate synthase component I
LGARKSQIVNLRCDAAELAARLLRLPPATDLFLFDSCGRKLGNSKFLLAGIYPIEKKEFFCETQREALAVLDFLNERLAFYQSENDLPFGGGVCAATLAYEFGMLLENLTPRVKPWKLNQPAATFALYTTVFIHDYSNGKTFVVGERAAEFAAILSRAALPPDFSKQNRPCVKDDLLFDSAPAIFVGEPPVVSNFSRADYLSAVEQIKKHIRRGNIYQANLTQQIRVKLSANQTPEQVFLNLRQFHPAPFAAFLRREKDAVVSASPERFFQIKKTGEIIASPIKGTRRRGRSAREDALLRQDLINSAKDRAENVMIVDLLRNDIGRVCEFGTVRAEKLCQIETHETLFHLVSTVRGKLRREATIGDALKAAFPCGSITGAPKISAMRILDQIETAERGLSMGAIGYFAFDCTADLNVAIRTMAIEEHTAIFNVGGGIVADSDSAAEYEESLIKARALLDALA